MEEPGWDQAVCGVLPRAPGDVRAQACERTAVDGRPSATGAAMTKTTAVVVLVCLLATAPPVVASPLPTVVPVFARGAGWRLVRAALGDWGADLAAATVTFTVEGAIRAIRLVAEQRGSPSEPPEALPPPPAEAAPGWTPSVGQAVSVVVMTASVAHGSWVLFRWLWWGAWLCSRITGVAMMLGTLFSCCCRCRRAAQRVVCAPYAYPVDKAEPTDDDSAAPAEPERVPEPAAQALAGFQAFAPTAPAEALMPWQPLIRAGKHRGKPYPAALADTGYLAYLETLASRRQLKPGCLAVLEYGRWHARFHVTALAAGSNA